MNTRVLDSPAAPSGTQVRLDTEILVVGAGFAGLAMAISLERAGMGSFVVIERAADLGGTWRENRYPGCACDIPSVLYSFSFARNPKWTRSYPLQQEIWDYLRFVADKFNVRRHIRFDAEMVETRWDEADMTWHTQLADGSTIVSRFIVAGFGPLSNPDVPRIAGLETFKGECWHSAQWRSDVDLRGKRVAVIGTGASAVQLVPRIAPEVAKLYVFQRTPGWILPKPDYPISPVQKWLRNFKPIAWLERQATYWMIESRAYGFTANPNALKLAEGIARKHRDRQLQSAELRAKMTPTYRLGCKRIIPSNDYYPAFNLPQVELVTEGIAEIREHSIVDERGTEREVDVIILGTGFRTTDGLTPLKVYGAGGRELNDAWRDGMAAFYGVSIAGFPNFFLLLGPNTALGHNSVVLMIEAQVRHLMRVFKLLRATGARAVGVREDVQDAFNARLQRKMRGTVWSTGCKSWYLDKNGKNTTLWPEFTFDYFRKVERVRPENYTLIGAPATSAVRAAGPRGNG
jgi:cation diffusion facilitator CzcD-associated flavoprotein CzcO